MSAVTDPNLIAILNAKAGNSPSMGKTVTDPNLIAILNQKASAPAPENNEPSFASKIAPNVLAGMAQLGHNLINAPHNLVNAVSPEMASHIPTQQNYDFSKMLKLPGTTADKVVQGLAANSPALVMGKMPLGAAGNAIRAIPGVGNFTANAISRIIPQGAFGAATSENPLEGGKNMAEMQAIAEALPVPFKALGKGLNYLHPDKYAQQILNHIGGGANIGENARKFAEKIQSAYNDATKTGKELYNDVFGNGINSAIHNNGVVSALKKGKYSSLSPKVTENFTPDLKDLEKDFKTSPNLQNAHELQSQLGYEIRRLEKMDKRANLSVADRSILQNYRKARGNLLEDMNKGFEKVNPELKDKYLEATENWNENVVPYLSNPKISEIVKTPPSKLSAKKLHNISNEFKNADEDMQKIASDVGHTASNHILYDKLGKMSGNVNSEKLINEINKLKNEGFGEHISPEIESLLGKLSNRMGARTVAQAIPGMGMGIAMGSHFGAPGEIIGSAVGGPMSVSALRAVNHLWPKKSLPGGVKNALLQSYQPVTRGVQIGMDADNSK